MRGGHRQRQTHVAQLQADRVLRSSVQPGERRHIRGSDRQQVDVHRRAARHRQLVGRPTDRELAGRLKEAPDGQAQLACRFQQRPVGPRKVQLPARPRPGRHGQRLGGKVHDHATGIGPVDRDRHVLRRDRHLGQARKRRSAGAGRQRRPVAAAVRLRGCQDQPEFHVRQRQADLLGCPAVQACEGRRAGGSDRQQIHGQLRSRCVRQRHRAGAALDGEPARHPEEVLDLHRQLARGPQQLAQLPVHLQRQARRRTRGHRQRLAGKVHHRVICGRPVDLDRHRARFHRHARQATARRPARRRCQGRPLSRAVRRVRQQGQREVGIAERQSHRVSRVAVQADKRRHAGSAQGQHGRVHFAAIGQAHVRVRLVNGKPALHSEETLHLQHNVA